MGNISSAWPFQEAVKIDLTYIPPDQPVIFETGFGPSGRPHLGTFAEVARTIMVENAFRETHPDRPTAVYAFCDDMDGLRKVPANLPQQEMLREHLGKPLVHIPDPFGTAASYAHHMEEELAAFVERFGFKVILKSSAAEYSAGIFNRALQLVLEHYEAIRELILPTLQEENREEWSPLIPVCEKCGRLYTTAVTRHDAGSGTLAYQCTASFGQRENRIEGCGFRGETSVFNGRVKAGWKVDWALRWFSYQVSYEMFGKDLIDSARLSSKICSLLGGRPPAGMFYELFLDEEGKKISKSVGEGLSLEGWLSYAPLESLFFYLYQNPRKQRRLYFDVIPKSVDDFLEELRRYPALPAEERMDSPLWHLEKIGLHPGLYTSTINFSLVLNLISALGAGDPGLLAEYLRRYDPGIDASPEMRNTLIEKGSAYFRDFIEPQKKYRPPSPPERPLFAALLAKLELSSFENEDELQAAVFDTAREHNADPRDFFAALYQVLLGQQRGPRFGTFAKLLGKERITRMLKDALEQS